MDAALRQFTDWWGPLEDYRGFAVIEIPDGWGSQADVTSIIQTAAAFKDSTHLPQLYHEISHQWNVRSTETFPPRWEEGLAMFAQYLVAEVRTGEPALESAVERYYKSVKKKLKDKPDYATTALVDFGRAGRTDFSYSMGMLFFATLYDLIGPTEFHEVHARHYRRFHRSGASTHAFADLLEECTSVDLTGFIDDWIFTSNYAQIILKSNSMTEVVDVYKTH
jgi:hypothetical protein